MGESYKPPFTMNEEISNLIVEIGEYVGTITTYDAMRPNPILRKENRIKTIHSSLAIEQNTLTLEQVTAVINGKRILGPPQDIREVKNAYEAYERVSVLDPYRLKNLLLAHKIMMEGRLCRNRTDSCRNTSKICAGFNESVVYLVEAIEVSSTCEVLRFSL